MDALQKELLDLLTKAEDLASQVSESGSHTNNELIAKSKNITHRLLGPANWARDVFHSPYLVASLQTASEAGWLQVIEESGERGISTAMIAKATSGDILLVRRVLRFLAARSLLKEVGADTFASTALTSLVCQDTKESSLLKHASQAYSHSAAQMPEFFSNNGFRSPPSIEYTPYAFAHGKPLWKKLDDDKSHGDAFNKAMAAASQQAQSWMDLFPIDKLAVSEDEIMLVDVGGGRGHMLAALAGKQPGRLVLQDRAEVVTEVPPEWQDVFEVQVHDFFAPQKVLHARAYYLRFVLHDWNDDHCVAILEHIRTAMRPGWSTLLINEFVLADQGCSSAGAGCDMIMMSVCAAQERTESEWYRLIDRVGQLRIQKIWNPKENGESVIEVVREGAGGDTVKV